MFGRVIGVTLFKGKDIDVNKTNEVQNLDGLAIVSKDPRYYGNNFSVVITGQKYLGLQRTQFKVSVYNLSPITRGVISSEGYNNIVVEIGYVGQEIDTIFRGTILEVYNRKENGNTWVTDFICISGYNFVNNLLVTNTFTAGTNYYDIAAYIAKHDLADNIKSIELSDKLKDFKLLEDETYYGDPYKMLDNISDETGLFYAQDNEEIKMFEWKTDDTAIIVNEETGMVDYPQLSTEGLTVKVLASPQYKIGKLIRIKNEDVNINVGSAESLYQGGLPSIQFSSDGVYIIKEMNYNLSNRGNEFYIDLKCYSRDIYNSLYGGRNE